MADCKQVEPGQRVTCLRCGYEWMTRVADPAACPACHSHKWKEPKMKRKGFTLVELLVVMAIIAIMAGLLMPAIGGALRLAHEASTRSTISQADISVTRFVDDYGELPADTWADVQGIFNGTLPFVGVSPGPEDYNQGSEAMMACLLTGNGGPYMEPNGSATSNTDGDTDPDVGPLVDSAVMTTALPEMADYWGSPIVYVHNRNYYERDGFDNAAPGVLDLNEYLAYVDADGNECRLFCAGPDPNGLTGALPHISGAQMFSMGFDGVDQLQAVDFDGDGVTDYYQMDPRQWYASVPLADVQAWYPAAAESLPRVRFITNWGD